MQDRQDLPHPLRIASLRAQSVLGRLTASARRDLLTSEASVPLGRTETITAAHREAISVRDRDPRVRETTDLAAITTDLGAITTDLAALVLRDSRRALTVRVERSSRIRMTSDRARPEKSSSLSLSFVHRTQRQRTQREALPESWI
jgi:hypothetical protein